MKAPCFRRLADSLGWAEDLKLIVETTKFDEVMRRGARTFLCLILAPFTRPMQQFLKSKRVKNTLRNRIFKPTVSFLQFKLSQPPAGVGDVGSRVVAKSLGS